MLRAVAEIAPKKLAYKFHEGGLREVALFDQSASQKYSFGPNHKKWYLSTSIVRISRHFLWRKKRILRMFATYMSGTDFSRRIPSQWSTLKKMLLIMRHKFSYVALLQRLSFNYTILCKPINNPFHSICLLLFVVLNSTRLNCGELIFVQQK